MQKPAEISTSHLTSKNPRKHHCCRGDSSVAWFNLGKRKPVKKDRCNELDEYTRKADSSQNIHTMENSKHVQQENAIISDFAVEIQEQGEVREIATSRAKRIRWMYLPENINSSENSVLNPKSLQFLSFPSTDDDSSLKPGSAAEKNTSKSAECDSSPSNLEDPDIDQVSKPSGVAKRKKLKLIAGVAKRKKLKLKGELRTHNDHQSFNVKDKNRDGLNRKTGEFLDFEVEEPHQYAFAGNDSVNIDQQDVMKKELVDVQLSVEASHRAENVPFLCLSVVF